MSTGTEQIFLPDSASNLPHGIEMRAMRPGNGAPTINTTNLENVSDFSKVCRVCATVTELVVPIYGEEGLRMNLADKIKRHLPIKVTENDVLPLVVCFQCTSTLLATHELVACSLQADAALRTACAQRERQAQQSQQRQEQAMDAEGFAEDRPDESWAGITEDGHDPGVNGEADGDDRASSDEDDRPLASLASEKADAYANFYNALLNFRNHYLNEHDARYPEFTESSESEAEANGSDDYDDLSKNNMRRDRMDEATRLELASAQTRINGKTYYTCRICGKHLSSPHTYVFHTRIHTGERPCVCHICGKQFRAPNGLQRHLAETHERRRRHACRHCDRTFANSQNLKQHMRTHTGERPYSCSLCGKRFRQSGSLHAHKKTHVALLPFRCAHCPAAFRLRAGLARHRLRHSGERPHSCEICGRCFRTRADLSAHRTAHSPARAHSCGVCRAPFRSRRALRHHARRLHPPPPPPPPQIQDDMANRSYFVLAPLYYRRCEFCPLVVLGALYNSHLLGRHADLVFHCDECTSYVARRQFLAHMTRHAHQYDAEGRRAAPKPAAAPPYSPPSPAPCPAVTTTAAADSTTASSSPTSDPCSDGDDEREDTPPPEPEPSDTRDNPQLNPGPDRLNVATGSNASPGPNAAARSISTPEPVQSSSVAINDPVENPVPAPINQPESNAQVEETNESKPKKTPVVRQCPHCPKTYTASSSYFYHLKYTHGKSREHECPTCGRRFGTRGALREHSSLHEPTQGLQCEQCGKRFRTKAGRYIHAQTHKDEKEKRFECAECGRAFRWRTELKRHVTRHAANRTHACECGRAFSVRADLLRHARTHRRAAHLCPHAGCCATFAQPRYLRAHVARKHAPAPDKAQAQRKSA